jgi:acetolactate synthase-1/3 small subunit
MIGKLSSQVCTNHTISILACNATGIMERICSLLNRRGFIIRSVSAGKSKDKDMIIMTVVVFCDLPGLEQIQKQLAKIIDVVKVSLLRPDDKVEREMALIKIKTRQKTNRSFFQLLESFKGRVVEENASGCVVEITGAGEKIDSFLDLIAANTVEDIVRTSPVALHGWSKSAVK